MRFLLTACGVTLFAFGLVVQAAAQPLPAPANAQVRPALNAWTASDSVPANAVALTQPNVIEKRVVQLDMDALAAAGPRQPLAFELGDVAYEGAVVAVRSAAANRMVIRGYLKDVPDSHFILSRVDDAVAGWFLDPSRSAEFELRYAGQGAHWLYRVDSEARLPCGGALPEPKPAAKRKSAGAEQEDDAGGDSGSGGFRGTTSCPLPQATFDYMVFYTTLARQAAGGTSAIQAIIQLYAEFANLSYDNSQTATHMRIVYCGETSYNEDTTGADPNDPPFLPHLERLSNGSDGIMDNIPILRGTYRADGVMLMLADNSMGGLAYCCAGTVAGTTATMYWANGGGTFAHEYGHNLGCAHEPQNVDCTGCYSDSRGHFFTGNDMVEYGTVMSYTGQEIPNFSNPNVSFMGAATGIPNQRDNAKTILARRFTMEAIFQTRFDIWVNTANIGAEDGTPTQPYNTLDEGVNNILVGVCPSELPNLRIEADTFPQTITISKPMRVEACGGTVRIGD